MHENKQAFEVVGLAMSVEPFQRELSGLLTAIAPIRPTPMLDKVWFEACATTLYPDNPPEFVAVEEAGKPVAAAAFTKLGRLIPRLYLLGAEELWEPSDILQENEAGALALAEILVARGMPIRFGNFLANSLFVGAMQRVARGKGFVLADPIAGAPFIPLNETWNDPEQNFSKRKQADLRRRRKKANAHGEMKAEVIAPTPENVDTLLDEAIRIEGTGWKGRSGTALAANTQQRDFFRAYARLASAAGIFRIVKLRIGDQTAAIRIGAEYDGKFWGFKTGYDEAYSRLSPGKFLFLENIRYAANAGLSSFEFLGNAAPWTREFTSDEHPLIRFRYYPYNLAGAAAFIADGATAALKRLKSIGAKRKP